MYLTTLKRLWNSNLMRNFAINNPSTHLAKTGKRYASCLVVLFQILFDGTRATGVEFVRGGKVRTVRARKEIVLSAGAIGSPHILMLSGIGHKKHLKKFGVSVSLTRATQMHAGNVCLCVWSNSVVFYSQIKTVADLPVGDNLQDHVIVYASAYEVDQPVSITIDKAQSFSERMKYELFGKGTSTSNECHDTQKHPRQHPLIRCSLLREGRKEFAQATQHHGQGKEHGEGVPGFPLSSVD